MKNLFALLLLLITVTTMSSCGGGGEDEPKPVDNKMFGVWTVEHIERDGVSYDEYYDNFRLTFSASGYSITGRPELSPFMPSGIVDYNTKKLTQPDGVTMTYSLITETRIELKFNFAGEGYAGGRVSGNWEVTLIK